MFLSHDFFPIQDQSHFTESHRTYKNAYFYNPVYSFYYRLYLSCFLAILTTFIRLVKVLSLRDMRNHISPHSRVTTNISTSTVLQSPLTKTQILDFVQPRAFFLTHRIPCMAAYLEYQLGKTKIISFQAYFNTKQLLKFSPKIRLQAILHIQVSISRPKGSFITVFLFSNFVITQNFIVGKEAFWKNHHQ